MADKVSCAERIRQGLALRGMQQKELCNATGIPKSAMSQYCNGSFVPKQDRTALIAKALDVNEAWLMGYDVPMQRESPAPSLPSDAIPIDFSRYHKIPILGQIAAGMPIYADENIEGYILSDLNGGSDYFALRVRGDSMNATRIDDGDIIIVRQQEEVDDGDIAVVLVDDEATVKRFYHTKSVVTLLPQSTNPAHKPQVYDTSTTRILVLGKVVQSQTFF